MGSHVPYALCDGIGLINKRLIVGYSKYGMCRPIYAWYVSLLKHEMTLHITSVPIVCIHGEQYVSLMNAISSDICNQAFCHSP